MEINERNIKIWSTIGSRATLGIVALELAKKIDNLIRAYANIRTEIENNAKLSTKENHAFFKKTTKIAFF